MGTLHATLILLFVFTIFLLLMLFFVYDILNIAKHYHYHSNLETSQDNKSDT